MAESEAPIPLETSDLGPLTVPRIWTGLWQLSSNAWGTASTSKIRQGMALHVDSGYTAFGIYGRLSIPSHHDIFSGAILPSFALSPKADHYGSAEAIFGQFRRSLSSPEKVIGATKWCVFNDIEPSRTVVEAKVKERMKRMQTTRVDLLQFHWKKYSDKRYLKAIQVLRDLQEEGMITAIGLCNFDTIRTEEICARFGQGSIVSNQVQFSLIDTRPLYGMSDVCKKYDLKLLTYGTLCGGLLSDKWLGEAKPDLYSKKLNPSQRKYLDMILRAWGTWDLFQDLLTVLRTIGDRHGGVSIANVATRWILDHAFVAAVLIGVRLGQSEHRCDNQKVFGFRLSEDDNSDVADVLRRSNACRLTEIIGDCGAEYRSSADISIDGEES